MEQNNKQIEFTVISGDDLLIRDSIESYNRTYKTDFEIVEFIYDEVVFAKLRVRNYNLNDIFHLGFQFGGYVQVKREKEEIDW